MKIAIFGLGSMGRRRLKCLNQLGFNSVYGYDIQLKRRDALKEAEIYIVNDLSNMPFEILDAMLICTPPDQHENYIALALEHKIPCFIEASVLLGRLRDIEIESKVKNILIAPSCTMIFHEAIKKIKEIVQNEIYGKVSNFSYHTGQFLPDWHPWESVMDFYVSNPETGGCREIVPFELTWLIDCFGLPKNIKGLYGRTIDVGAPIDDTYAMVIEFNNAFGTLLVDVTSRHAIRKLTLNFELAQLQWQWDQNSISIYFPNDPSPTQIELHLGESSGNDYNPNIIHSMYLDEVRCFIEAIITGKDFPNSLDKDIGILNLLLEVEAN